MAPRFDGAPSVLLLEMSQRRITATVTESFSGLSAHRRLALLAGHQVEVVLCLGILRTESYLLEGAGIEVCPGLSGPALEVAATFAAGR